MNWSVPGANISRPVQTHPLGMSGQLFSPARDVTMYSESLRGSGAYPYLEGGSWRTDAQSLTHVMQGYFERSRPFVFRDADRDAKLDFFLTNEPAYPAAIGRIKDIGGAFIGVGRSVPVTYAAWQDASHAYIVDKKAIIPMGFTPIYGAWLCMAKDRFEFLSLILGRPLTRRIKAEDFSAQDIVDVMRSMPFDDAFARAVVSALTAAFARSSRLPGAASLKVSLKEWMAKLNKSFFQRRSWEFEEMSPAAALMTHDAEGRGGALSSEISFNKQRDLFLQSRITGVSGDMIDSGLDAVEADIRRDGQRLGAVYISNIEDQLLFNYLFDEKKPDESSRTERVRRYYEFYRRLAVLPDAENAFVVSAKKRRPTSVDRLARYVRRSMPLELGVDDATGAAKDFYRFRVDVEALKGLPPMEKMERISKICRTRHRFNLGLSVLRSLYKGGAANRELFEERLSEEFERQGMDTSDWWRRMFVDNLEEFGLVTRRLSLF